MTEFKFLIGGAFLAFALSAIAAWCYRGHFVPVHWFFLVAMSLGSVVIAAYYIDLMTSVPGATGHLALFGIRATRWIHGFILFATIALSLGALLVGIKDK